MHARAVPSLDTVAGMVLAVVAIAGFLAAVLWLDSGPVGRQGRALRRKRDEHEELPAPPETPG